MAAKTFKTYALGFPVIIINPTWRKIAGEKVLDVDFTKLAKAIFPLVLKKKGRLTGGEIKFIREYLKMTQEEFAQKMGLKSHAIISKWESKRDKLTNMNLHTESIIRMYAADLDGKRISRKIFQATFEEIKGVETQGDFIEIDPTQIKVA